MTIAIGFLLVISLLNTLDGVWQMWLTTAPLMVLLWLGGIRPWLRIEGDELVIQNAIRRHRIPRTAITGAEANQYALYIYQGRKPSGLFWKSTGASAVSRPNIRARVARADLICDELQHWVTDVRPAERHLKAQIVKRDEDWRDVEWVPGPPVAERAS